MTAGEASPPAPLRVRLDGPEPLHARAAWALEALLARARVLDWAVVDGDADLAWGGSDLPCDPAQWQFAWDAEPDATRDPLAAAFWWLARVEEQLAPETAFDEHGRFRFDASAMARQAEPLAAPVDELALALRERLEPWRTPLVDGVDPTWRLVLTHDIDLPWRWTPSGRRRALRSIRDDLSRARLGSATRTLAALAARPFGGDPWDNARRIARLEADRGARSTSYLLVGCHAGEDGDPRLHELGDRYHEEIGDGEAGLHGSYTSSVVVGRLAAERDLVERRVGGPVLDHRFHYLRHRPVDAWPLLERVGIRSDSSLGFAEQPGLRAGTAHPFRAWDHDAGAPLDLVVIPLAVMDASYDERYLGMAPAARRAHVQSVLERVISCDGCASLLVHNDRLCNSADGGWTRQYRDILRMVQRTGGLACSAGDAAVAYRALLPAHRLGRD